jgi:hypothetical protein
MAKRNMAMVKAVIQRVFRPRSIIAIGLMLWCAGTSCLVVGYARSMKTENQPETAAAEQSSAGSISSKDAHACCKARRQSAGR